MIRILTAAASFWFFVMAAVTAIYISSPVQAHEGHSTGHGGSNYSAAAWIAIIGVALLVAFVWASVTLKLVRRFRNAR